MCKNTFITFTSNIMLLLRLIVLHTFALKIFKSQIKLFASFLLTKKQTKKHKHHLCLRKWEIKGYICIFSNNQKHTCETFEINHSDGGRSQHFISKLGRMHARLLLISNCVRVHKSAIVFKAQLSLTVPNII